MNAQDLLSNLETILVFIIAFGLLMFVHETGHYLASKVFGIQVEEFGFGFPPRLIKLFQFKETEFTLNWLPFGAFVRPKGENDPGVPGGLGAANAWVRLLVFFAGPFVNLVVGMILFVFIIAHFGVMDSARVPVEDVAVGSPAQLAGLQKGDRITLINGQPVGGSAGLQKTVAANLDKPIQLTLLRGGQTVLVELTPRSKPPAGQGAMGVVMGTDFVPVASSRWLPEAYNRVYDQINQTISLPGKLLRKEVSPEQGRFVGPVGIYSIFQNTLKADLELLAAGSPLGGINTSSLIAILSVALGITNLLPIPALDGGRILLILPELILRRRIPAKYENIIHLVGFALVILLSIYITTQDILNPIIPH